MQGIGPKGNGSSILRMALFFGWAGLMCVSCGKNPLEGMVVAVALEPGNGASPEKTELIALDPGRPGSAAKVITGAFHAARTPSVSYDGRYLLFSGKMNREDPWQIWCMDLVRNTTRQVIELPGECTDPAYLPDGRIVFSRKGTEQGEAVTALFKCNRDGTELQQLTFHPHEDLASSILQDGRILYTSIRRYPETGSRVLMVMRPDGTKSELFYKSGRDSFPASRGMESENGKIYFIERDPTSGSGNLVAVHQNRPLHSRMELSEGLGGDFRSVTPYGPNQCLVSYRPGIGEPYAIRTFDTGDPQLGSLVYQGEGDVFDPVWIQAIERPRRLPSEVNPENPTGLLMSQDINHSRLPAQGKAGPDPVADRIQVWGMEGILGEVKTEEDGSFYLKVDADTPIRLLTLNEQGELVRGPSDWIWLRPNERRGCVGCHADPELSPENKVPLAVKQPPVIVSSQQKDISKLEEPAK